MIMRELLMDILKKNKVIPYSEVMDGGKFYKIKSQSFVFPDGSIQSREFIDKKRASVVVPITEDGNVLVIVQPIALAEEGSLIEFPAGYWEFNEDGKEAGIRELAEETGYAPENIVYLGSHYQDPGSIRTKVDTFLATGCKKVKNQNLDEGEFVKYIEIPYELAIELMNEGLFMDSNSYIAFSKANNYLEKKLDLSDGKGRSI
jgi:ADP-ribose pyrophosphatase